ncbi:MAG: 1,4-beta-xylanase [Candidatus Dadabacteria bacterium]|nr:MAG: 1,4-beta-xylanase [Candidatus Dadabacteria bacterium]
MIRFACGVALALILATGCDAPGGQAAFRPERDSDGRWTAASAQQWYAAQPWFVGVNYIPADAVNELEMWQADTFNPDRIDLELGWAEAIGFNVLRVFLHDLLWQQDPEGFLTRIDQFLAIANEHGFRTSLVLFDNVWNPDPQLGPQPDPIPGIHNSRWVQSPAQAETLAFASSVTIQARLRDYVQGVVARFATDSRVLMWEAVNEPGNSDIGADAVPLLRAAFDWIREVGPRQPATASFWSAFRDDPVADAIAELADIHTFHSYYGPTLTMQLVGQIDNPEQRPVICTEYMARSIGSTFEEMLPLFREENIGAISWGLVAGRTQTYYPWTSTEGAPEPELWFHDILREDGTPRYPGEVSFLTDLLHAQKRR